MGRLSGISGRGAIVNAADTQTMSSRRYWWASCALALAAAGLVVLATRSGPGIGADSTSYFSSAHNLASGSGYRDFTGEPLNTFPPGFSGLLALGELLGVSLATTTRAINAVASAAVVVLSAVLIQRHAQRPLARLTALALVAFSIGLLHVADKARSDALFVVFVVAFIVLLENALTHDGEHCVAWSAAAGATAGLAFLVRYAALSLLLCAGVAFAISWLRSRPPQLVARVCAFTLAAVPLPALWLARNSTSGAHDLLGPHVSEPASAGTLIKGVAVAVGSLFSPNSSERAAQAVFVLLIVVAGIGTWLVRRSNADVPSAVAGWTLVPLATLLVAYPVFVLVTHRISGTSLDERVLARSASRSSCWAPTGSTPSTVGARERGPILPGARS